jgi:XisH protein
MPAIDQIHGAVRNALIKDGWTITHDPYVIRYEEVTLFADLGAERLLAVERGERKIVIEIKSFTGASPIHDLKVMLGQYDLYRGFLEAVAPERRLHLAVSDLAYQSLFTQKAVRLIVERYQLPLLVVNTEAEEIVTWTA